MTARARKLCEGWLEYKPDRWQPRWVVLRGDMMYIFTSRDTAEKQQHCGTLPICPITRVVRRKDCNQNTGFKFDVETDRHSIRFKSKKFSERELWRGYIIGVANGTLPNDIDLLDDEIETMKRELELYRRESKSGPDTNRNSVWSEDSGVGEDMISIGRSEHSQRRNSSASGSSGSRKSSTDASGSSSLAGGGPTLIHRFYEKTRDQTPPSWFLSNCSRELAETVLQKGRDFGNTLMRESRSHMQSGSYSISKAVWDHRTGKCSFEHYEVMQVARGYKLNVENEHEPMRYLTQIMEYFVKTTAGSSMPMSTNDLRQLGVERQSDYDRVIRSQQGEAWVWPPPDYDEAESPRTWPVEPDTPRSPRSQTVTPSTSQKKVGWSASTVSIPSNKQRSQTSMSDIADRTRAAEQLQQFDRIIDQYDQQSPSSTKNNSPASSVNNAGATPKKQTPSAISIPAPPPPPPPPPSTLPTMNSHTATKPVTVTNSVPLAPPPPPAPPTAHQMSPQHSFVNEGADDRLLASLGVAPPPPRVPLGNGPTSSPASMSSRPQSMGNPPPSPSVSVKGVLRKNSQGDSVSPRPVSTSASGSSSNSGSGSGGSNGSWQNPNRLSQSGASITGSPSKLPTWSTSSPKPCVNSPAGSQSGYDDTVSRTSDAQPGVDDKTPGGVHNLRSKFEKQVSVGSIATGSVEKRPGAVPSRRPVKSMSAVELSSHLSDDLYEELPPDYDNQDDHLYTTNTTYPSKPSHPTNFRHSSSCVTIRQYTSSVTTQHTPAVSYMTSQYDEEELYDDTAVERDEDIHTKSGGKRVTIQEHTDTPARGSTVGRLGQNRRQSEPAVLTTARAQSDAPDGARKLEGLNLDFKNKLEGLFGGAPTGQSRLVHHENEYEELPDGHIVPDEVTYVNDAFNKQ